MSFTVFYGPLFHAFSQGRLYSTTTRKQTASREGLVEMTDRKHSSLEVFKSRPSNDLPEAITPVFLDASDKEHCPPHEPISSPATVLPDIENQEKHPRRRRKKVLVWTLIGVILLLVVAGAVIGGVVSLLISRRNSYNASAANGGVTNGSAPGASNAGSVTYAPLSYVTSNVSPIDKSGIAVLADSTAGVKYVYQQIADGSIVEVKGSLNDQYQLNNATIVTKNAILGGPLAAVSYSLNNTRYRSLAYTDASGNVLITNTTGAGWSTPINVMPNDTAVDTSPALALCADTDHINGLRLYYPSRASTLIQEVGLTFNSDSSEWTVMQMFHNGNVNSGVACTITNGMNRVYYRRDTNVEQVSFDYTKSNSHWTIGRGSAKNASIAATSAIAAASDNTGNDYIFYRLSDNTLTRGSLNSTAVAFQSYVNYTQLVDGSKFDTAYIESGNNGYTWLLSQPAGSAKSIWNSTSSDGAARSNGIMD